MGKTTVSTIDLGSVWLDSGGHENFEKGVCALELASVLAGEEFSDRPACVSVVLGAFGRRLNDALDDAARQRLIPYIPRMLGTSDETEGRVYDHARREEICRWLFHETLPDILRQAADSLPAVQAPHAIRLRDAADKCRSVDVARFAAADADAADADAAAAAAADAADAADADAAAADAADAAAADADADAGTFYYSPYYVIRRCFRLLGIRAIVDAGKVGAPWEERRSIARAALEEHRVKLVESLFSLLDRIIDVTPQEGVKPG